MKQTSKHFLTIAAASALIIGVATGAFGGGGFVPGGGGHLGMMGGAGMHGGMVGGPGWMASGDPVDFAEERLTELEATLGITPAQEGAWTAYADAIARKAALMASHREVMHSGTITADEGPAFHQEGIEQMQEVITAADDLYAVLTPEQQAKADGLIGLPCFAR